MGDKGRYLYAVTRGVEAGALRETRGLDENPVETVEERGLVAVIGAVDLDEYGEAGLRRHLEDLAWLERVARTHDDVVRAVADLGPTAPLRLATICMDDEGVKERLREWHEALTAALDRVEGRAEWSVKAYSTQAGDDLDGGADTGGSSTSSQGGAGASYLRRKRSQAAARLAAEERGADGARAVHEALGAAAVASRLLAPQDPGLTKHQGIMRLNGAYLVPVEAADAFMAEVARQAALWHDLSVEVNGPWPPYSFATLEQP